ncbi:MAG: YhgE/Pip domain-containing protein [Cytophagales bacterium]|nr:YhgE/Pip domain-containing protein [Rhizobacter sp.]
MKTLRDAWAIARLEAGLFKRFPTLGWSVLGVLVIPALYAFIYLASVWDPASRTGSLPAAIVNLDQGVEYRGQKAHIGADLSASLQARHTFGFQPYDDEQAARQAVREGRLAMALIIPRDFSANAVPGLQAGAGRLIVYTSEGNNYTAAGMARRFAAELGHQVNETLNEKRWELVLTTAAGSQRSVRSLKDGVAQLRAGSHELDAGLAQAETGSRGLGEGARKLSDAAGQLTGGMKQVAGGVRTIDAKRPAAAELQALRQGAHALVDGHAELGKGLEQLQGGAQRLTDGARQMRDETQDILFVGEKLAKTADTLGDGGEQLVNGLQKARGAQLHLGEGANKLQGGVGKLTEGMAALGDGVHAMATKLPEDAKLDEFKAGMGALAQSTKSLNGGLEKLHAGSAQLAVGLALLGASLPSDSPSLEGSAKGLADSVEPVVEVVAPVANNGTGFAPNFVPVALWLGAVMMAFMFHLRRLPEAARSASRLSQVLGKLTLLVGLVVLQATIVLLMLTLMLNVNVPNLAAFWLTLALASVTFLLIILALTRAFGDVGKALALVLLILQLSSAGGILPVELSGDLFRDLSPWLPFTWVVRAFRASLFGAYDNAWVSAWGAILLTAAIAFVISTLVGRWRFVSGDEHRPALDL